MSSSARLWVSVSLLSLGQAIGANGGTFSLAAITLLAVALAALMASFSGWPAKVTRATRTLLACGLLVALGRMVFYLPGGALRITIVEYSRYLTGCLCLCVLAVLLWHWRLRRLWFPALLLAHTAIGAFTLHYSRPNIDVLIVQRDAANALLAGLNPYALTFPDPYHGTDLKFYGEGVSVAGRLMFGFPYPPLSLLLVMPAQLAGDVRYAHLGAILGSAILMYRMARDTAGRIAAALFLFTPGIFSMVDLGWTEALAVLALTLCVARPRAVWPFAILLGIKQYIVLVLPAVWRTFGRRTALRATVGAVLLALPLVLWNVNAFLHSVVWIQSRLLWRTDSLSFAILLSQWGLPRMPWLGLFSWAVAAVYVWRRRDTDRAAFARNFAFVFLSLFSFSWQAFYNYYFLIVGALCCAIVASGQQTDDAEVSNGPPNHVRRS